MEAKSIKVTSIPGSGTKTIEYESGQTVKQILEKAGIQLTPESEILHDGAVVTEADKVTGGIAIVVGKRSSQG